MLPQLQKTLSLGNTVQHITQVEFVDARNATIPK